MTFAAPAPSKFAPERPGRLNSAAGAELAICVARIVVVGALMVRFAVINPPLSAWAVAVPATIIAFLFSGFAIVRLRAGDTPGPWLWASTCLDSALSFAIVANNILTPWTGFPGVLAIPDTAIFVIVTFAAGFRHSLKIVGVAVLLNLCLIVALVRLEFALLALPVAAKDLGMWAIFIVAAGCAAGIAAGLFRALSVRAVANTTRLAAAHEDLRSVLVAHHDAYSILTAVTLSAGMLKRAGDNSGQRPSALAEDFLHDLEAATETLRSLKTQAREGLDRTHVPICVDLTVDLPEILSRAEASVHPMRLALKVADDLPPVPIAGGRTALWRILANLVSNARAATLRVPSPELVMSVEPEGGGLVLKFDDNGPGFDASPLNPRGQGVGLHSVRQIVAASGGEMHLSTSPKGGARVALWIPLTNF